ncbi:TPA: protein kinase [Vibrio cholerae]|uniref:protein kinase domain-containing protein n=2 Tax=Vibrio cholerae TaxID=666 RepID=UPI001C6627BB|nr:protein kinase [Vibrio cholerae]EHE0024372.1 protein kinase [Vibrio cholerae]HDZ3771026.1 protein kinase [Vibrio cholerae]
MRSHFEIALFGTDDWFILRKKTDDLTELKREYDALISCKSRYVQEVLGIDLERLLINLVYYDNSRTVLNLCVKDQNLFINALPNIIRAIQHCHDSGWVHGDIKPSNILIVSKNGCVRLIDFSAALPIGYNRRKLLRWYVTPSFANNNQLKGEGIVSTREDWLAMLYIVNQFLASTIYNYKQRRLAIRTRDWLISKVII